MRAAGVDAFGVNLFVPGSPTADPDGLAAYVGVARARGRRARGDARRADVGRRRLRGQGRGRAGRSRPPRSASPSASPTPTSCGRCRPRGRSSLLTVTTPEEAALALRVGPDALCLQGAEAGAHRGSLANDDRPDAGPAGAGAPRRGPPAHPRARWSPPAGWAGPTTWPTCWPGAPTWSRPGRRSCAAPRAARRRPHKDALADPRVRPRPRSPAPSAAGGPARWSTPWCGTTRARPPPTPRSTTPPGRCGPPPAAAGDPQHMSLYAGTAFRQAEARPAAEVVERLVSGVARGEQPARQTKTIEFTPPDVGRRRRRAAHAARRPASGWINLMPGIDEDAVDVHPPAGSVRVLRQPGGAGDDDDGHAAQEGPARRPRG